MMEHTYIYMHHDGSMFFMTDRKLTPEECYCSHCNASDELLACYDNESALSIRLKQLFEAGYDLVPCEDYLDIKDKYCPPELRLWELGQFKEGSAEYMAYAQRLKRAQETYWKKEKDL